MFWIFNRELYPMLGTLSTFEMMLVNTTAWMKTDLRDRLNQDTLDNLMLIAIEGSTPEDFSYKEALKHWSKQK